MSTPAWKKEARRKQLANEAAVRRYNKQLESNKKIKREFVEYKPKETYVRETPEYPSLTTSSTAHATAKREPQQYTGDYITGIATMHKSNLVPVSRGVDPKDYATMRRS